MMIWCLHSFIDMNKAEVEMTEEEDVLVSSKARKKEECCVFNFFADALEILTPGVITQSVTNSE